MLCYKGKEYSKINVVGTSGSGKTSFRRALSELTEIKHIEIDRIFWGPNWYWPPDEEFFANLSEALDKKEWILDGNYSRSIPIKWKNTEMVIWLDYCFHRTLFQAVTVPCQIIGAELMCSNPVFQLTFGRTRFRAKALLRSLQGTDDCT